MSRSAVPRSHVEAREHAQCACLPKRTSLLLGRPPARHRCRGAARASCDASESACMQRRSVLHLAGALLGGAFAGSLGRPAAASGLLQFPLTSLSNDVWLVRAGEGVSEAEDTVLTNTVYKTNVRNGLSSRGKQQVLRSILPALEQLDACPEGTCWLWPSITARSYQTAEILASITGAGYRHIQPEYSFLDPRGAGALEGSTWTAAAEQIALGDASSPYWRPTRGEDGTPSESAEDVLVRTRQMLSIIETQYRGSNVLIISPDSDNLSILQAGVLGIDLRRHRDFAFLPGEVRPLKVAEEKPELITRTYRCKDPPRCTIY